MNIVHVVGARPNFMKLAPLWRALDGRAAQRIIHTGQHYDANMSEVFFRQLGLPQPDVNLEVGSGSATQQTAAVMTRIEEQLRAARPDLLVVYGDVNACLAAGLAAARNNIAVAHVEAGLRSRDRRMPEELNRILTDHLSTLLFAPSQDGMDNLRGEGIDGARTHLVGNIMIDTLVRLLPLALEQIESTPFAKWTHEPFALVTLHRPSNVDDPQRLRELCETISGIASLVPVIMPVHPRTRARLADLGSQAFSERVLLCEPLGYLDFLALEKHATIVITDSGGVQEETTYLGIPCLTLRSNTERPVTVTLGTNELLGDSLGLVLERATSIVRGERKHATIPPLWDGQTAERIASIILRSSFDE